MLLTKNFEKTERRRRRRPKVVPRAAADFVRQLKIMSFFFKDSKNYNLLVNVKSNESSKTFEGEN